MTSIPDEQLFQHANRVKGKVVLITGAANGIGKETATFFGSHGARVVIGDYDASGAENTVSVIKKAGGTAIAVKTDVTVYENQVALYERAIAEYGAVDIVVANAGVTEVGSFAMKLGSDGKPVKPNTTTLDVNLVGSVYTAYLAQHYLSVNRASEEDLKAIILIGSIASWMAIPGAPMYSGSKHGVLGLMSALHPLLEVTNIRIGCVCPFFADTAIVPPHVKLFLAGIPKTPVSRVARAIFYAATDNVASTNGAAWLLLDSGNVFMLPREQFKLGVYGMLDQRVNALLKGATGIKYYANVVSDVTSALRRPLMLGAVALAAYLLKDYAPAVQNTVTEYVNKYTS